MGRVLPKQMRLDVDGQETDLIDVALPRQTTKVAVSPIKSQGIKTKLVPFILSSIRWSGKGRWIEPFVGSGVVALNLAPSRALLTDVNVHIIRLYNDIGSREMTPRSVRHHLEREGRLLFRRGEEYYYEVRDRFNHRPSSHDFLFLNRSCFNGMIRFNGNGQFNVPFCKKPDRFRPAYVTKIVNQVDNLADAILRNDWTFDVLEWTDAVSDVGENDFVYADPPYLGRHTDYYNSWTEYDATDLLGRLRKLPCGFALSMWKQNKYRQNPHLPAEDSDLSILTTSHFYHVGSLESLRNEMEEALVIKEGYVAN